jgi:trimethylguanosine synthase
MITGWKHRSKLFSRFNRGIQFDKAGFESAKSEAVANFVAKHLPGKIVLDAFTGIGGSVIGFARAGKKIVSIEIVAKRSEMAQHNAAIYGVAKRINFVIGDTMKLWNKFDFDSAYFDPPWGGVGYEKRGPFKFTSFKPNVLPTIKTLIAHGKNVAITLPLNFDLNELKRVPKDPRVYFMERVPKDHRLYFNDQYGEPYCIHCIWLAKERA